MKAPALTSAQMRVLRALAEKPIVVGWEWHGGRLHSFRALKRRGLIEKTCDWFGSYAANARTEKWVLTDAGRAVLAEVRP